MSKRKSIIYKQKAAGDSTPPEFVAGGIPAESEACGVLADWLVRFEPARSIDDGRVELRYTVDIINELSTMCDLEIREVVAYMTGKGYHSYHDSDGVHGWMLKRID